MEKNDKDKPIYTYEQLRDKYLNKKTLSKEKSKSKGIGKAYAVITSFIFTLVITIFAAIFLGTYLDELLNTKFVFMISFLIIGIIASFRNLIIYTK